MQLNQVKPIHKSKDKKRVGRGGKRGTYSGRGMKGQKARAGHKIRPEIRDLIKKLPKLRGYRFKSFRAKPAVLNLRDLQESFDSGSKITPEILARKGLAVRRSGNLPAVKILGDGEITKKLVISDVKVSESARKKIEKAGGTVN